MRSLFSSEPNFLRIWAAQCISQFGDWFQFVALVSLLPSHVGGARAVGGLLVVRFIPTLLFMPIGGVLADRFSRKRLMIIADLLRAVTASSFLFVRGPEDLALIYGLSVAQELLTAVFEPARGACIPTIVRKENLYAANTLGSATWSVMLALGAGIGGAVVARLGTRSAFVINAATFVLSAVFVALAKIPKRDRPPKRKVRFAEAAGLLDLKEGASYLRRHSERAWFASLKAGLGVMSGGTFVLVALFADRVFSEDHAASISTGLLYAARGVGALVGPFAAERIFGTSARDLRRTVAWAFPFSSCFMALLAVSPTLMASALLYSVAMMGTSAVWVASTQLLQLSVDNRVLGRVISVEWAGLMLTLSGSSYATSWIIDLGVTPRQTAIVLACVYLVPGAAWLLANRRLDRRMEEACAGTNAA